jgi:two-component system chemotaxis response regulator CheY
MFMRETIKKALLAGKHEVVGEADTGRAAVMQFKRLNPDLVLMDITMPQQDGLSAMAEILQGKPDARVVICSALGQEEKVMEAMAAGARDYVTKPFTPDQLLAAVARALE